MKQGDWQRILELFDQGIDVAAGERDRWLNTACGADTALRAEVERLLKADDSENGFLQDEVASYAAALASPALPERIGPYRILKEIGRGGMGAVYLAERADDDHERKVAIKVVHPGFAASALIRRFRAERQILARLQHPNIAQMLDGGVTAEGVPYLVMEHVDGVRIDEYCARSRLRLEDRLELFRTVCAAVQYAHQNLVVHRDIKPSNILVTPDGVPKLLDFGIAKLTRTDNPAGDSTHTAMMERPMTPEYASPEQIQGNELSTATDVYSLGIVLYELLAGERPFRLGEFGPAGLIRAISEDEPRAPSETVTDSAAIPAQQLRGDLDHIVMMAIRKEPLTRYQSVEHLAEDIGKYLGGYPVRARRGSHRYHAAKFIRRHRLAVATAVTFLAVIVAFVAAMAAQNARVTHERDIARREREVAQKVSNFLISLFEGSDPFRNNGAQWTARQLLDSGADRLGKELQTEPEVRSELLETVGQAYKHLGELDQAERMFREKVRAVDQAWGPGSPQSIRILRQLGDTERMRGKSADAERDLRQALSYAERLPPGQDYELAQTLNNLSLIEAGKNDYVNATEHSRRAVAIIARYPKDPSEGLTMRSNLGMMLYNDGRAAEAEPVLRQVLEERRRLLGESHPQVPTSMRRLATVIASRGSYLEAEQLYRDAGVKFRKLLGPEHSDVLLTDYFLAGLLTDEGKYAESETLYRSTVETEKRVASSAIEVGLWSSALAWTLFLEGKTRESQALLEPALTVVRSRGGAGAVREARVLIKLGYVQAALGRLDDAQTSLDEARGIYRTRKTAAGADTAEAAIAGAWLERLRGANEKARTLYEEAVANCRAQREPDKLLLATLVLSQADFLIGMHDPAAARALVQEAREIREKQLKPGFWAMDVVHFVQAELSGSINEAEASFANLRTKLGDNALEVHAAAERLAAMRDPARQHAFSLPLF